MVASGESIVLGGLIREDNTRSTAGIPLLSKIPVIGAAFGTQQIIKRRTETILLIRPTIITNVRQAAEATRGAAPADAGAGGDPSALALSRAACRGAAGRGPMMAGCHFAPVVTNYANNPR